MREAVELESRWYQVDQAENTLRIKLDQVENLTKEWKNQKLYLKHKQACLNKVEQKGRHVDALQNLWSQIRDAKAEIKDTTDRIAWMDWEHKRTRERMNELEDKINKYNTWIDWVRKGERVQSIKDHFDVNESDIANWNQKLRQQSTDK